MAGEPIIFLCPAILIVSFMVKKAGTNWLLSGTYFCSLLGVTVISIFLFLLLIWKIKTVSLSIGRGIVNHLFELLNFISEMGYRIAIPIPSQLHDLYRK